MKEGTVTVKAGNAKKDASTPRQTKSIYRMSAGRELGTLKDLVKNINHNGTKPSADSIATELSVMPVAQRASVLLGMQHTHGNRYVQQVVAQAKLMVGQPGDIYEREADRVAKQVVEQINQPVSQLQNQAVQRQELEEEEEELLQGKFETVQRQEPEEEEEELLQGKFRTVQRQEPEEEEEELQMMPQVQLQLGGAMAATPELESSIQQAQGVGHPLSESIRVPMEQAFEADFSSVRIHTDAQADKLNRSLNARAFTTGQDIFLRQGEYHPRSREGQVLLAHELTHTIQQTGGQVKMGSQNQVQPAFTDAISRSPSAVVQREVMSTKNWLEKETSTPKKRSPPLTAVDTALEDYHKVADPIYLSALEDDKKIAQAGKILDKLFILRTKIDEWVEQRAKKSKARAVKVQILKEQVVTEIDQIQEIKSAAERALKQAEQAGVRNQILTQKRWGEIKDSDNPKTHATEIFNAFMVYGRENFTYDFKGRGDLLTGQKVGACGSFALALGNLFKYVGIKVDGLPPIPEKQFITVPLDKMNFIEEAPAAANVKNRGSEDFNRFLFGTHFVLKSEAGTYDPTTGCGPGKSAVAVDGFLEATEDEKELFNHKKDKHRLKAVQEEPRKYEYWEEK